MEVNELLKKFWKWRLHTCPEFATFCGIHDYNSQLQSFSIKSIEKEEVECKEFLNEAQDLLLQSNLEDDSKENLQNLVCELKIFLDGSIAKGYYFPVTYFDGPHVEFQRLINAMPQETKQDYENILSRFKCLPKQITEIIDLLKVGISQNMTFHKISVASIPEVVDMLDQLSVVENKPNEYILYKPFIFLPDTFTEDEKKDLQSSAKESLIHDVIPAFKLLSDFFKEEYFNHTRPEIAVSRLPDGKAFYQKCLDFHLSLSMTPEQVHSLGLQEVDRISNEMKKVINSLNLNLRIQEFITKIRSDEKLHFDSPDKVLSTYKHLVFEKIHSLLPKIVKTIPETKLEIRPADECMSGGPAAYYLAGSMDGKIPGVFYVNTADCSNSIPKYEAVTLALHEAIPGHHLQAAFMMENEQLPTYRRFVEDRKYSIAPSRFPLHTAYMEGWGLYCEYLGYELGLYEDPYDQFGHLSLEMMRATRLVIDTGIHAFGWSFDKAVEYMLNHTAMSKVHIIKEVNRYITWPGQACAYKIGELKLKSLRKEAETALGSRFDIKEFHDMILHNCGPLDVLEQKTKEFIKCNT